MRTVYAQGCVAADGHVTRNFKVSPNGPCDGKGSTLRIAHDSGRVILVDLQYACDERNERYFLPPFAIEGLDGPACGYVDNTTVYVETLDRKQWLDLTLLLRLRPTA